MFSLKTDGIPQLLRAIDWYPQKIEFRIEGDKIVLAFKPEAAKDIARALRNDELMTSTNESTKNGRTQQD